MADKPRLSDLLAAPRKRSAYRGAELRRIREEQDLTTKELAEIMHCTPRAAYQYLSDEQAMLNCRWRLLLLELGIKRPAYTPQLRTKRRVAQFIGGDV